MNTYYNDVTVFFRERIGKGVYVFDIVVKLEGAVMKQGTYMVNVYTEKSYLYINPNEDLKNMLESIFDLTLDWILKKIIQEDANEQAEKMEEFFKSSEEEDPTLF